MVFHFDLLPSMALSCDAVLLSNSNKEQYKRGEIPSLMACAMPLIYAGLGYVLREVGCNRESVRTRYAALMRKLCLSAAVIFRPVILRKMRAMGI
jgi:hypothetical protein